jgi:hypothetical protein
LKIRENKPIKKKDFLNKDSNSNNREILNIKKVLINCRQNMNSTVTFFPLFYHGGGFRPAGEK